MSAKPKAQPRRRVYLRYVSPRRSGGPAGFVPADAVSEELVRRKRLRQGDLVRADVTKTDERNGRQWRAAHALGKLIAENSEQFEEFASDPHAALKRLQVLSGVGCDDQLISHPGLGKMLVRTPRSLAFDEMPQDEWEAVYSGFCEYIRTHVWPGLTDEQIQDMARLTGDGG